MWGREGRKGRAGGVIPLDSNGHFNFQIKIIFLGPQLIVVNYKNTHDKIYFPLGSLIFNLLASGSKQIFINLRGRGIKI